MSTLYANPYDTSRPGFYFDSLDEYEKKGAEVWGTHREQPEHSIEFIDGDAAAVALWDAGGEGSPGEVEAFFDWEDEKEWEQAQAFAAMVLGYASGLSEAWEKYKSRYGLEIDVREGTLKDLAAEFVEEGIIDPANYFDYEKFGRTLDANGDMTNHLDPDDPVEAEEILFYENMSHRELGEYVLNDILESDLGGLANADWYMDEDAAARDLGMDYMELEFAGSTWTARGD